MKKSLQLIFSALTVCLALAGVSVAQTREQQRAASAVGDMYVISAKAGGVNHVEGKVTIVRKQGKSGVLLKNDSIAIGDRVSTGPESKAEIMLNPGSFLRLGSNTTFEFVTTSLDDLRLKLTSGSAIFEVYADDEFKVGVSLPKAELAFTRSGVFRVDVLSDGTGKLSVWKGRAIVGTQKAELKSGRMATIAGTNAAVAKFDRDNKDDLDIWSQLRAKEAAKINSKLERKALGGPLMNSFNRGMWNMYNSFGVWVYNPYAGRWCFLPFGSGWNSPYGYGYYFDIWYVRLPYWIYVQPPQNPTGGGGGQTGGGTRNDDPSRAERRAMQQIPPIQRIQNTQPSTRGDGADRGHGGGVPGEQRQFEAGDFPHERDDGPQLHRFAGWSGQREPGRH